MKTTLDKIIDAVVAEYHTSRNAILSDIRTRQVSDARHTIMYLALTYLTMKQKHIAKALGKSISAVSNGITSINNAITTEESFRLKMNRIYKRLKFK